MINILDIVLLCPLCKTECKLGDSIAGGPQNGFVCPRPDCGGSLVDHKGAITPDMVTLK